MEQLSQQHALVLVSAPASLPVSVQEAKEQMRVEHSDDDALIDRLINAAVSFVDATGVLGKAIITQTWGQWVKPNPGMVRLAMGPVQTVTAVEYYNTSNILTTDVLENYEWIGPPTFKKIKPREGFTWPNTYDRPDAIRVQYQAGFGDAPSDVPEVIRHALMMLVSNWYENRENELIGTISKTLPFGFDELIGSQRAAWYG